MKQTTFLLLTAFMFCTACSDARTATTAPPSTTSTVSTTTAAPSSTTSTTEGPPDTVTSTTEDDIPYPDTSGDDWERTASDVMTFWGWLYENPRPELVDLTSLPGSDAFDNLHGVIAEYFENGWRDLPGGRAEFRAAELQTLSEDGTLAQVLVVDDFDGALTVDMSGEVVKEAEDRPPRAWSWKLRKTDEGWRIIQITYVGEADWEVE